MIDHSALIWMNEIKHINEAPMTLNANLFARTKSSLIKKAKPKL
ncbi:hypothetical protein C3B79_2610 [Aeromonas hydrophila]|nr:hypothetical protein C3B79_2610 [Aeromonas hydrophila]